MTSFAEEIDHTSRSFVCGWSARAESSDSIARGIQALARALAVIEPAYGELWPFFEARNIRPGDPGPVLRISPSDFGKLIDRRARFDPPQYPAPVGPEGYSITVAANRYLVDQLGISISIRAGDCRTDPYWYNNVHITLNNDSTIWTSVDRGRQVLSAMIEAWSPQWGCASAFIFTDNDAASDDSSLNVYRPWLAWAAAGAARPHEPYDFTAADRPGEVQQADGGELRIWR